MARLNCPLPPLGASEVDGPESLGVVVVDGVVVPDAVLATGGDAELLPPQPAARTTMAAIASARSKTRVRRKEIKDQLLVGPPRPPSARRGPTLGWRELQLWNARDIAGEVGSSFWRLPGVKKPLPFGSGKFRRPCERMQAANRAIAFARSAC
jgi:hypothetical protein